jgi:hypothetical protein
MPVVVGTLVGALLGVGLWFAVSPGDDDDNGGPDPSTSTSEPGPTTSAAPDPGPDQASLTGTWTGTYECAQGPSDVTLTVVDLQGDVDAFFEFGGNGDVPPGAYTMAGTNEDGVLTLDGDEWIEQPDDYAQVGLIGEVSGDSEDELTGTVEGEGCTTFSVSRTSTDPWYVDEWEGAYDCGQGLTGLTVTIEAAADPADPGAVTGTFSFFEVPQNPGVPSGSYRMEGTYADGDLSLEGVEWVDQPDSYVMVGLESDPDMLSRPSLFAGKVTDPSCTAFILRRAA